MKKAMFSWNQGKKSAKLALSDEDLKCLAVDGSGFKSVVSNLVHNHQL